ncbi:MAG: HAMP domain-containing histidine kinase [Acidimicrobiia bacterium]|nr:HAMP domain-containing histidine kinase [Acidimicrobiia bacterium]
MGLALVFALVFSIAFGSKGVAQHAKTLHAADEALRAATVARAQVGMAAHLVVLQAETGFEAVASVEVAMRDTRFALDDLAAAVADLEAHSADTAASIESAAATFGAAVTELLGLAEAGDGAGLRAALGESFDRDFRLLTDAVVVERDYQASQVAAADDTMGRVGDIARFLVAFVVPLSAVIVYRELTRRQHRQKELEVRLETEQELGKARDEFVANASHELRTPLTSIFGMAHLLEEDEAVRTSPAALEMLGLVISEAHDLNRMVDDLLTTARLDAGALHYQFESLPVVPEVIDEVVEPMRRAGITLEVACRPALVRSDRLRLRQVVRNLLSNAGKYGGPQIRLLGEEVDGWYEVRVEDDGEGIPPELEARLFQRFLHKGDMPLVLGSVGLGLSIVRALAEGMGGAVWYERRKGWTCFVVRVPLAAVAEAPQYREGFSRSANAMASAEAGAAGNDAYRTAEALRSHTRR